MASDFAPFCASGAATAKWGAASKPHGHVVQAGRVHDALVFAAGAVAAVLLLLGTSSFLSPPLVPNLAALRSAAVSVSVPSAPSSPHVAAGRTFYDDPDLSYSVGRRRLTGWDAKRARWLRLHYPRGLNATGGPAERVVMVSGSQFHPCKGAGGDNLLLRFLKNKLDYCRLHGIKLFYNTALFHPEMRAYWAKVPVVRAPMLVHPEAEWIWWLDADAVLTDMDFSLPLHRYKDHNLLLYGWDREVYDARSWLGLNAGVFLIRNCQWSLDFMDAWARMGPASPNYAKWGKLIGQELDVKADNGSDDQAALVYLPLKNPKKWRGQDIPPQRLLLPGVLGGDCGSPGRNRGAVPGGRAARARGGGAPPETLGGGARAVRGGEERGREEERPGAGGRRADWVAAAVRDALHGLPALRRKAQRDLLQRELRRRDAPCAHLRRRPGAPRVRVPPRRPAQRRRAPAPVRLPGRAAVRRPPCERRAHSAHSKSTVMSLLVVKRSDPWM